MTTVNVFSLQYTSSFCQWNYSVSQKRNMFVGMDKLLNPIKLEVLITYPCHSKLCLLKGFLSFVDFVDKVGLVSFCEIRLFSEWRRNS